jgi:PHS family inorganic phosphate transporter-like MFS transporter
MMVAVFLMQPLGQFMSQLVAYGVLRGYNNSYDLQSCHSPADDNGNCGRVVDSIWRWIAGVGAIPALIAIFFRFQIEDPGMYDLDVKDEGVRAVQNTMMLYPEFDEMPEFDEVPEMLEVGPDVVPDHPTMNGELPAIQPEQDEPLPVQFSWADITDYFFTQGNWRSVAGTSMCWFLLDM